MRLIIPDIHEKIHLVEKLFELADRPGVEEVICLGDYFDKWGNKRFASQMCCFLKTTSEWTHLIGNHDVHYFYPKSADRLACSGYDWQTNATIQEMLTEEFRNDHFRLWVERDGYLLSHAGFAKQFLDDVGTEEAVRLMLVDGNEHPLLEVGRARGGNSPIGGCFWLDWNQEFNAPESFQIVGHTIQSVDPSTGQRQPAQNGNSWCLDTDLQYVGWLKDGILTTEFIGVPA